MRKRSLPQPEERTERRISAATSLSICALTVIAQIVLTLALTQLLAEKISYVYFILELAGAVVAIWVYLRPGRSPLRWSGRAPARPAPPMWPT